MCLRSGQVQVATADLDAVDAKGHKLGAGPRLEPVVLEDGVDTASACVDAKDAAVGRFSAEENVRELRQADQAVDEAGASNASYFLDLWGAVLGAILKVERHNFDGPVGKGQSSCIDDTARDGVHVWADGSKTFESGDAGPLEDKPGAWVLGFRVNLVHVRIVKGVDEEAPVGADGDVFDELSWAGETV